MDGGESLQRRMGGRPGQASKVVQKELQVRAQSEFLSIPVLWSREERGSGFAHMWGQSLNKGFFFFFLPVTVAGLWPQ